MNKIIGIDTGGTYTDTVVILADTKEILYKEKTLTTKRNLLDCIETSIAGIPRKVLSEVSKVCLSTTLATNAIVENAGSKVGLFLIGETPKGYIPADLIAVLKGKHDIMGRQKENLDPPEVDEVIEAFRGKVETIAVSGYASVRNPSHEQYVKDTICRRLEIPVACAHELTSSMGFYERTVTTVLNAKLIPIICELIDSVKAAMDHHHLNVPLLIVKGDGGQITDVCAKSRPIETILSGPAASVVGGLHLCGMRDALVLDMGGTTTDIANASHGCLNIRTEGAIINGWQTHVKSAEVFTVGLGGDSRIFLKQAGVIGIGPQKAIPYSRAGAQHPQLQQEYEEIIARSVHRSFSYHDEEAYILSKEHRKLTFTDIESTIIAALRLSPHTLYYLSKNTAPNLSISELRCALDSLLRQEVIERISLTPTDLLHATGQYSPWNSSIAEIGTRIAAE